MGLLTIIRIRSQMGFPSLPARCALSPFMYVCLCNGITESAVRDAAASGARSVDELGALTGCGSGCGSCVELAQEILDEVHCGLPLAVFAAAA